MGLLVEAKTEATSNFGVVAGVPHLDVQQPFLQLARSALELRIRYRRLEAL